MRRPYEQTVAYSIGTSIRYFRHIKGWSQSRLGKELGITFQQVQKYEKGQTRVCCSTLCEIAELLQAPISAFFQKVPEWEVKEPDKGLIKLCMDIKNLPARERRIVENTVRILK